MPSRPQLPLAKSFGFLLGLAVLLLFAVTAFGADQELEAVRCASLGLVRSGVLPLGDLIHTKGDLQELRKLPGDLGGMPLDQLEADPFTVWTEPTSGLAIYIPHTAPPEPGVDYCLVHTGAPNIDYVIALEPLPFNPLSPEWELAASRQAWLAVHRTIIVADEPMLVRDTQYSDGRGLVSGAVVERRMTTGRGGEGNIVRAYRNDLTGRDAFASIAVVDRDAKAGPAEMTWAERLAWARGVLTVDLAAFPALPAGPKSSGGAAAGEVPLAELLSPGARSYPRVRCGEASLMRLSQPRRLNELADGDPPPADLDPALQALAGIRQGEIAEDRFDLWAEPSKGAIVLVPHALTPTAEQRDCRISAPSSAISYVARVFKGSSEDISVADWRYRTGSEVRAFARELASAAGIAGAIDPASRFHAAVPPNGEVGGYRITGARRGGGSVLISLVGLRRDRVLTLFAMIDPEVKPADELSPADRGALALGLAAVRLSTLLPPTGLLNGPKN